LFFVATQTLKAIRMMNLLRPMFALYLLASAIPALGEEQSFKIQVIDEATGRGVPLVELRTVNDARYVTDSNGVVAFREPGLLGRRVFFHVASHGYGFPQDGFGYRGKALQTEPGGSATLKIKRINLAERLYRVTGEGIYRDSILTGEAAPTREPLLNGDVFGSDSVVSAVYRGRIHWFWGDTNRPGYPLGNFHVPGAVSKLPEEGGLDPACGVDLEYFTSESGFAKSTAKMPGDGPTWISGLTVLTDDEERERMFAAYVKIKPPLEVYRRGLIEWSDEEQRFEHIAEVPADAPVYPDGHPFLHEDGGVDYVYFATPYPLTRVRAAAEAFLDPSQYEAFTCLVEGGRLNEPKLDRGDAGRLRYSWKRNTPAVGPKQQEELIKSGLMERGEALLQLRDRDSGRRVQAHSGSVYWNAHRRRWVMITGELMGQSSLLGEVWYAEAETPLGPWAYAVKIVTHDDYSFYNPKQHPIFDQNDGRVIYFEGTYTHTFSGNPLPTPRYDYNQIMYRLDLTDPRTALPVAVYGGDEESGGPLRVGIAGDGPFAWEDLRFFALDRPGEGTVPVYQAPGDAGLTMMRPDEAATPLFHALPPESEDRPDAVSPAVRIPPREFGPAPLHD
jgi:hypothetical protein